MNIDKILLNKVKDLEMYKIISNPINNKNVVNKLTINNAIINNYTAGLSTTGDAKISIFTDEAKISAQI